MDRVPMQGPRRPEMSSILSRGLINAFGSGLGEFVTDPDYEAKSGFMSYNLEPYAVFYGGLLGSTIKGDSSRLIAATTFLQAKLLQLLNPSQPVALFPGSHFKFSQRQIWYANLFLLAYLKWLSPYVEIQRAAAENGTSMSLLVLRIVPRPGLKNSERTVLPDDRQLYIVFRADDPERVQLLRVDEDKNELKHLHDPKVGYFDPINDNDEIIGSIKQTVNYLINKGYVRSRVDTGALAVYYGGTGMLTL